MGRKWIEECYHWRDSIRGASFVLLSCVAKVRQRAPAIRREWEANGFEILSEFDELPWQHLVFLGKKGDR